VDGGQFSVLGKHDDAVSAIEWCEDQGRPSLSAGPIDHRSILTGYRSPDHWIMGQDNQSLETVC